MHDVSYYFLGLYRFFYTFASRYRDRILASDVGKQNKGRFCQAECNPGLPGDCLSGKRLGK